LAAKIAGSVPSVQALAPTVSGAVAEVIGTLLQPSPQGRYRSAAEAAEALCEATRGEEAGALDWSVGALTGRARLVEREAPLGEIGRALGWIEPGEGGREEEGCVSALWVSGESGVGCSRVLREAALQAQLAEVRVLGLSASGRGCALDAVARVLGLALPSEEASREEEPAERQIWWLEQSLEQMLQRLQRSAPLLVVIDQGERLDPLTREWVRVLARRPDQGALSCLVGANQEAQAPHGVQRMSLSPLSARGISALVWNHLGVVEEAEALSERLWQATGGNPSLLEGQLQHLIEADALRLRGGRWYPALEAVDRELGRHDPGELLRRRLERLPEGQREALCCAAALGAQAPRALLEALSPGSAGALAGLEAAGLLKLSPAVVEFVRAPAQRAAYGLLSEARRVELHRAAFAALEGSLDPSPEAMARHALGAGMDREGARWARVAARRAERLRRWEEGAGWLEQGLEAAGKARLSELRVALLEELARARQRLGQAREAEEALTQALLERPGAPLYEALGQVRAAQGDHEGALAALAQVSPAEEAQARSVAFARGRSLLMVGRAGEARAALEGVLAAARAEGAAEVCAEALVALGTIACHEGRHEDGVSLLEEALTQAQRAGAAKLEADAWLNLGTALRYRGDLAQAGEAYQAASQRYQALGLLAGAAKGQNNEGVVAYLRGRWGEAQRCWESFAEIVERLGLANECVHAYNNLGTLYKDRGELEKSIRIFHKGVQLAREIHYVRFEAMLLGNLGEALLRQGRFEEAEVMLLACRRQSEALGARGEVIEADRRLAELELARGQLAAAGFKALQTLQEGGKEVPGVERGHLLRIAGSAELRQENLEDAGRHLEEAVRCLEKQGARYELGMALIAQGQLQCARQDPLGALHTLDRAIQMLEPLGARRELQAAQEALRDAQKRRRQTGGDATRLRLVLDTARKLGPIQSLGALLNVLLDVALEVTNHERGFVLLYKGDRVEMTVARRISPSDMNGQGEQPSQSIAREVARTRRAVGSVNLLGDARFNEQKSVLAMGLCSVRCVPILLGERLLGVLYVDSRRVDRPETVQEELDLLEALAGPAAMAVENARLLAEERRKADLIAKTAHEISRPLAAIQGFAYDLNRPDSQVGADERRAVRLIVQQSERLARLTQHMVDLGRMEAAEVQLQIRPVEAAPLCREAIEALGPLWERKGQRVHAALEGELPALLVDRDRIIQVLTNLLGNAIKFAPEGGQIILRGRRVEEESRPLRGNTESWSLQKEAWEEDRDPHHMLRLEIDDDGPGIPEGDREAIFEPFVQRSTDAALRRQGTGLGLTITREIVLAHGGRIQAEASDLGGARLALTLPLLRDAPPAGQPDPT
jgi:signal transduction histidine kinase